MQLFLPQSLTIIELSDPMTAWFRVRQADYHFPHVAA
jgi:hypothetical protein